MSFFQQQTNELWSDQLTDGMWQMWSCGGRGEKIEHLEGHVWKRRHRQQIANYSRCFQQRLHAHRCFLSCSVDLLLSQLLMVRELSHCVHGFTKQLRPIFLLEVSCWCCYFDNFTRRNCTSWLSFLHEQCSHAGCTAGNVSVYDAASIKAQDVHEPCYHHNRSQTNKEVGSQSETVLVCSHKTVIFAWCKQLRIFCRGPFRPNPHSYVDIYRASLCDIYTAREPIQTKTGTRI